MRTVNDLPAKLSSVILLVRVTGISIEDPRSRQRGSSIYHHVLYSKTNCSNITTVALALVEEGNLCYEQVRKMVEKDKEHPVVK
jgi:hypothetical protein